MMTKKLNVSSGKMEVVLVDSGAEKTGAISLGGIMLPLKDQVWRYF